MTSQDNRASVLSYVKHCALFESHQWIQTGVTVRKPSIQVKNYKSFVSCELELWQMTLKSNRVPHLCYYKLYVSFHSHRSIETSYSQETPNSGKNQRFEIWQMTLKNKRYDTSRFRYHFIAIGRFELELQTGNTQFGSNSMIFFLCDLAIWWITLNKRPVGL